MVEEKKVEPLATEEPAAAEAAPKTNVDDLIAELEKAGVSEPQQLQGKLEAGAQAGKLAQLLGDERKRVTDLQAKLDKVQVQPKEQDWDAYPEGKPIDIEAAIERSIDKTFEKREKVAKQVQEASIAAYNYIKSDQNFHLVKDVWDKKVKDPAYIYQVQTGQVDPVRDYSNTVVQYFQNVAQRSLETIKELSGGEAQPVPHVESGETRLPANIVSESAGESANRKFLTEIRAKIEKGYIPTYEEEGLIAEAVLNESMEI